MDLGLISGYHAPSLQTITFTTGMTVSPKQDRDKLYVHYCIFRSKSFRCDMPKANRAVVVSVTMGDARGLQLSLLSSRIWPSLILSCVFMTTVIVRLSAFLMFISVSPCRFDMVRMGFVIFLSKYVHAFFLQTDQSHARVVA